MDYDDNEDENEEDDDKENHHEADNKNENKEQAQIVIHTRSMISPQIQERMPIQPCMRKKINWNNWMHLTTKKIQILC